MYKILIAPKSQYGYITDYYRMINHLAERGVAVEVVCFDQGYKKLDPPGNVTVNYVHRTENKVGNYTRHLYEIAKCSITNRKSLNWVVVSSMIELSGILPFLLKRLNPRVKWITDIRTCSVVNGKRKRDFYDFLTLHSARFFDKTTVISELVAKRLKIKEFDVLPLGAECYIDLTKKQVNRQNINFLYVGTFDGRRIEDLVKAFDIVSDNLNQDVSSQFDIVGYAESESVTMDLMQEIKSSRHKDSIIYHGRKSHKEIHELFRTATIGFSYVPITDFFDVQPPTKTYEYIMNGIICIGTNTKANAEIITSENGVLIEDNVESLVEGMEYVVEHLEKYDLEKLSRTVSDNNWEDIVEGFHSFLNRLESDRAAEPSTVRDIKGNG